MASGRELPEPRALSRAYSLGDRIVAENGALVWAPDTKKSASGRASALRVERLRQLGVSPLSVGRVIVATWEPHESTVLEAIRELGLEHQVIFNKGAVMILPSGVNKATGLRAALADLGLSPHNAVAVGDAENDHTLLAECEAGVAVQNALPMLKERADWVTAGARGEGVVELAQKVLATDLSELEQRFGTRSDRREHLQQGIVAPTPCSSGKRSGVTLPALAAIQRARKPKAGRRYSGLAGHAI